MSESEDFLAKVQAAQLQADYSQRTATEMAMRQRLREDHLRAVGQANNIWGYSIAEATSAAQSEVNDYSRAIIDAIEKPKEPKPQTAWGQFLNLIGWN